MYVYIYPYIYIAWLTEGWRTQSTLFRYNVIDSIYICIYMYVSICIYVCMYLYTYRYI